MKTLRESLFDKNLTDKPVGYCLMDKTDLFDIYIEPVYSGCGGPPYGNKSYLDLIDWKRVDGEISKMNITTHPNNVVWKSLEITYGTITKVDSQRWPNALKFANVLLHKRMADDFEKGNVNTRFRDEMEKYLKQFISGPTTTFEVCFATSGLMKDYVFVKLIGPADPKDPKEIETLISWQFKYKN